jgi:hypothetical protein
MPELAMTANDANDHWSQLHKLAFRFIFVYCVLYLPVLVVNAIPGIDENTDFYVKLWDGTVVWVGEHVLHLREPITVRPNGSGDTTWNYVQVFCFAVLASASALIWTIIDFRRPNYRRLNRLLRIAIRYSLAMTMIVYGSVKVIQSQFPAPAMDRLLQPYGESSPMGLLWTFMGASYGYNIFAGTGELLGGLLLTTRRTTLQGALINLGVMGHVAVLNYCYDVPVKLLSTHLVVLDLILIAPDVGRLVNFLLLDRGAPPSSEQPLVRWPWLRAGIWFVRTLLVAAYMGWCLYDAYLGQGRMGDVAKLSPLYGIWDVEEMTTDGQDQPPKVTNGVRWRRMVFARQNMASVQLANDSKARFMVEKFDETAGSFNIKAAADQSSVWTYRQPEPNQIILDGTLMGQTIHVKLRKMEKEFLLRSRGFHWISEYPFNR